MAGIGKLSKKSDRELVSLLMNSSQQAFEELYVRYKGGLVYHCKWFLKDETGSEDIVQDIFMQLWEKRESLNIEVSFSGYVYTLAQNRVLNVLRKFDVHSRFVRHIIMNGKDSTNQTEESIIDSDYAELLNGLIENLSPRQKEVFRLSRTHGLTYGEIAELMQISVDTVREHASIALKKIKKQLIQHTDIHFKTVITLLMLLS